MFKAQSCSKDSKDANIYHISSKNYVLFLPTQITTEPNKAEYNISIELNSSDPQLLRGVERQAVLRIWGYANNEKEPV